MPEFDRPGVANVDKVKGKVSVFLGIPYAQAPKGEARLMPPRPHKGWQTYDAVDWAPVCPQPIKYVGATKNSPVMDEDCLYLNVFTPEHESTVSQLFPVMIYIHGGHFQRGSANEFPGHQLAANGQVVVVAINYNGPSAASDALSVHACVAPSAPGAPTRVTGDDTSITLAWTAPADDGERRVQGPVGLLLRGGRRQEQRTAAPRRHAHRVHALPQPGQLTLINKRRQGHTEIGSSRCSRLRECCRDEVVSKSRNTIYQT